MTEFTAKRFKQPLWAASTCKEKQRQEWKWCLTGLGDLSRSSSGKGCQCRDPIGVNTYCVVCNSQMRGDATDESWLKWWQWTVLSWPDQHGSCAHTTSISAQELENWTTSVLLVGRENLCWWSPCLPQKRLLASGCFHHGFFLCVWCRPHYQLHSRAVLSGLIWWPMDSFMSYSIPCLSHAGKHLPFILPVYSRLITEQSMPNAETFKGK